ncbi:VanW family protein [Flavobacterium sp. DGU11]|uniref:VanW family protein n=1 Tax=Flavobacterium arundinis TaxID=3139143 RepID=A0ABU9HZG7_9FLAO
MRKIKVKIKVFLRLADDLFRGTYFKFPKKTKKACRFDYAITVTQEVKPSETFDNKIYNLTLASEKISQYVLLPNQVFSFWSIIGNPEREFKKGRSIINGQLSEESGGGLCQVSGIIYYAALLSGLQVLERHNHSMDIYMDETRFTPLGTDATVVYGYKDLRVRNNFSFPLKFHLEVEGNTISASLQTAEKIQEKTLSFAMENSASDILVTVSDEKGNMLNKSEYRKL